MTSKKFHCRNCKKEISEEEVRSYLKMDNKDFIMSHASVVCKDCLEKRQNLIRQNNNLIIPKVTINFDEL